jgi:hypothetical protein
MNDRMLPGSGAVKDARRGQCVDGVNVRIVPTLLIADERGEINTRNMRLLTKTCADYPLQPLPRKSSTRTLADTSRVFPDSKL